MSNTGDNSNKGKRRFSVAPCNLLVVAAFLLLIIASFVFTDKLRALELVLAVILSAVLVRVYSQKRKTTQRAQIMLDSMPLGVSFLDNSWTRIDCNRELYTMLGLSSKQEYLERYEEVMPEYQPDGKLSRELLHEKLGKTFYSGFERFEMTLQKISGEPMPCLVTLVSARQRKDNIILMYLRDMRDLKSALDEMRHADEYMKLMLDAMPMGCSLWDKDFNIIDCNMESVKLFRVPDKQSFMENFMKLSPEFQPCCRLSEELVREVLTKAFENGYNTFEWSHQTLDGEVLPCEIIMVRVKHKDDDIVAAYTFDMRTMNSAVDAMHKAEEDMRAALGIAEESAKAKGEFLDNMSHELRTPMNGIMGFLRMALKSKTPESRKEHELNAMKSAEELLRIIDKILDFTELEESKMKLNAVPFNLKDTFYEIIDAFAIHVKVSKLDFNLNLPAELDRTVVADSAKLKQVMTCLIDNAFKFTDKGKITVRASITSQDEEHIDAEIYVRDTGIGMTPEQVQDLFTPFSQANMSSTRVHGGTGLELALCKHLVNMLGGRIWAQSEYGEGSTFWFSVRLHLPEKQEVPENEPTESTPVAGEDLICEETAAPVKTVTQKIPAPVESQLPHTEPPEKTDAGGHDPRQIRILLAEDVEINQVIAKELLTGMGYTVDIANNGQEVLNMLSKKNYQIIMMDIQMPVMDGLTAAKRIREMPEYKDLPIIAVTAHALPADREKSLNNGMNDHITKPLDPEKLSLTLAKWLSGAA